VRWPVLLAHRIVLQMKEKSWDKRLPAIGLILLLGISAPFFAASIISLLEPVAIWVFLVIVVFLGMSIQGLFERTEGLFTRIIFFLTSLTLLIAYWYYLLRPN
jgi:hypothetical protein